MAEEAAPELRQQRMKEFMSLLPLTMELAGLPDCQPGTMFNEGQMEVRVISIRNAYILARGLLKEIGENAAT